MKGKAIKRIVAAAVAIIVVGTGMPADIGFNSLLNGFTPVVSAEGEHEDASAIFGELDSNGSYLLSSQTYTLTSDLASSGLIYVPNGVTAVIDLDGHTINRGATDYSETGSVFVIAEGGSLTVKNGIVKGGAGSNGGGFNVNGELVLDSVIITENKAENAGGGIFIGGGNALAMLKGNCVIQNNFAENNGSGIYVSEDSVLSIEGKPVIRENNSSNVYLSEGRKIEITGELEEGSSVGVTYLEEGKAPITNGYNKYNTVSPDSIFTNDKGGLIKLNNNEAWTAYEYEYRSWNEKEKKLESVTKAVCEFTTFDSLNVSEDNTVIIGDQWVVLKNDAKLSQQLRCVGTANILLCDGKTLYCDQGIDCSGENKLNIYGQKKDTGKLESKGNGLSAAIGGIGDDQQGKTNGEINIYGGTIKAQSCGEATGIGSACKADMEKDINIFGGKITATGEKGSAGIGAAGALKAAIRIYGGNVTSTGGTAKDTKESKSGAGIGSGYKKALDGKILICGGTVSANGGKLSAGIGSGYKGKMNGEITIQGGNVTAKGNDISNGIGTGDKGSVTGKISILGGKVTVVSGAKKDDKTANAIQAIGYKPGINKLELGSGITVSVNGTRALSAKRASTIASTFAVGETPATVVLSECDHHEFTYTVDPSDKKKHIGECKYCQKKITEDHDLKADANAKEHDKKICTVCGYTDDDTLCTVSIAENDGKKASDNKVCVVKDKKYFLPSCNNEPEYQLLTGWKIGDDTELKQPGDEITVTEDIKVEAQYAPVKYAITYELNGGKNNEHNPADYTAFTDDIKLADPTGKTDFLGWYDNEDFENEPVKTISKGSHKEITLYAKWSEKKKEAPAKTEKKETAESKSSADKASADKSSAEKADISAAKIKMGKDPADVESVVLGDKTLKAGEDYSVTYMVGSKQISKPTVPGTYTAVINGIGSYEGKVDQKFTIGAEIFDVPSGLNIIVDYEKINPTISYVKGNTCVKLNWKKIDYARKYAVCIFEGGEWKKIAEGYGASYVMEDLVPGRDYRVAVIALVGNSWNTNFSNAITVTPKLTTAFPSVTYMVKNDRVIVNWSEVTGAGKYGLAVYLDDEWKVIEGSMSSNTFTFKSTKLKPGYTYKVAVGAKIDGKWDLTDLDSRAFNVTIQ